MQSCHIVLSAHVMLPICVWALLCAHDQPVKAGQTTGHYGIIYWHVRTKHGLMQKAREIGLSTPAGKKTSSARHASHRARIEPKPRPMCPAGLAVSGYLAFCRKVLVRREKLRKVRKFHKHNYTQGSPPGRAWGSGARANRKPTINIKTTACDIVSYAYHIVYLPKKST